MNYIYIIMTISNNNNTDNVYTLLNINELYNTHYNINRVYHFNYNKNNNHKFNNFNESIFDKTTHHSIFNVKSYSVHNNNLILESTTKQKYTFAFHTIPNNYVFNILVSPLDGKTLIIYAMYNAKKNLNYNNLIKIYKDNSS